MACKPLQPQIQAGQSRNKSNKFTFNAWLPLSGYELKSLQEPEPDTPLKKKKKKESVCSKDTKITWRTSSGNYWSSGSSWRGWDIWERSFPSSSTAALRPAEGSCSSGKAPPGIPAAPSRENPDFLIPLAAQSTREREQRGCNSLSISCWVLTP